MERSPTRPSRRSWASTCCRMRGRGYAGRARPREGRGSMPAIRSLSARNVLAFEGSKAVEVEHGDAAVLDANETGLLERLQRLVHALPRQTDELAHLLLRQRQCRTDRGVERRVEESRERAREPRVGPEQPAVLDHRNELPEPLVQLHEQEAVERHARVEQ